MPLLRRRRAHLAAGNEESPRALYLDLMKRCLTNSIYGPMESGTYDASAREEGRDWPPPPIAHTMIGMRRLDNIQHCVEQVLADGVPGDFIETGVWRGGATIFMRAILKAHNVTDRAVWVADSFQGLPPPNAEAYPMDTGDIHHTYEPLQVSLEAVQRNFAAYGLLDSQVRFLPGWFRDTLPGAPIARLAVLRLDGDMYESTIEALESLYDKISPRGFIIVDDYGAVPGCRAAVDDFRSARGIAEPMLKIDWTGTYWRRSGK